MTTDAPRPESEEFRSVLDRLPDNGHALIYRRGEYVQLDVRADNVTPQELTRIAQHLLEAAGHPVNRVLGVIALLQDYVQADEVIDPQAKKIVEGNRGHAQL